jgi:hypothetical protein
MPGAAALAGLPGVTCYEALLDAQVEGLGGFTWPTLGEDTPCGLCYTSGTTGNPKVRRDTREPALRCVCGGGGAGRNPKVREGG